MDGNRFTQGVVEMLSCTEASRITSKRDTPNEGSQNKD